MENTENKAIIRLKNLTTGYRESGGEKKITEGLDAELHGGELTALLGPNGAGKSTLLRTLAGFQPAVEGEILVGNKSLSGIKGSELARLLGVVLTEKPQLEHMTVRELVELGRAPYTGFWGRLGAEDHRAVEDAICRVGITSLAGRGVSSLSDGERQKVMIAKALAQDPRIIILDEPTAFLDYPSKVEIMLLLRELARTTGKIIFMSTHDLELALQVSDSFWLIDRRLGVSIGKKPALIEAGLIGKYFERPGLRFDSATETFKII